MVLVMVMDKMNVRLRVRVVIKVQKGNENGIEVKVIYWDNVNKIIKTAGVIAAVIVGVGCRSEKWSPKAAIRTSMPPAAAMATLLSALNARFVRILQAC